ncbi:MAG TPA: histidine phosphatase family protein [Anaerolineaceae bacterium]|nr:histidine phosphatase family protein [Anaerolineaceae bacterium]
MTTLLLIRHGQNDFVGRKLAGRLPGVHLNERGRRQAEAIAEALKLAPLKAIYSSPLERAVETAEPLARLLNLPIQPRPGLMEIDFGGWQGKTMKQMARLKLWKTVQERPSQMVFPGGESFAAAQQRIVADLQEIAACHEEKDLVACFSHSDAIKLAIAHYLGMPLDNFQRVAVDPTSITALFISPEGQPFFGSINLLPGWSFPPAEKKKKRKRKLTTEHTEPTEKSRE